MLSDAEISVFVYRWRDELIVQPVVTVIDVGSVARAGLVDGFPDSDAILGSAVRRGLALSGEVAQREEDVPVQSPHSLLGLKTWRAFFSTASCCFVEARLETYHIYPTRRGDRRHPAFLIQDPVRGVPTASTDEIVGCAVRLALAMQA